MADQPLTPPRIYLIRMAVFLVLAGFVAFILYRQIWEAFQANPGLNALILGVMFIGIVLAIRQVWRLFPEVRWVNTLRQSEDGLVAPSPPVLLAPLAALLGNRPGQAGFSVAATRSVLDSIGARLDESREIVRYLAGLLVFLGLLGTFWGLIDTVGSVGRIISSLRTGQDTAVLFDELKNSLAGPLQGMGLSFRRRSSASPAPWSSASSIFRPARPRAASTRSWRTGSPPPPWTRPPIRPCAPAPLRTT